MLPQATSSRHAAELLGSLLSKHGAGEAFGGVLMADARWGDGDGGWGLGIGGWVGWVGSEVGCVALGPGSEWVVDGTAAGQQLGRP